MPRIILQQDERLVVEFSLFDGDYTITGQFFNKESFVNKENLVVEYQVLLQNLKERHCYLVKTTTGQPPQSSVKFVLASNIDDLSIYILDLEKEYESVEVKRVTGFKTEDITPITKEELKRKHLIG
jgi:hypothetical protein